MEKSFLRHRQIEKRLVSTFTIRPFDEVHYDLTDLAVTDLVPDLAVSQSSEADDNHPLFSVSEYKLIVSEKTPSNTPVLTVSATDVKLFLTRGIL